MIPFILISIIFMGLIIYSIIDIVFSVSEEEYYENNTLYRGFMRDIAEDAFDGEMWKATVSGDPKDTFTMLGLWILFSAIALCLFAVISLIITFLYTYLWFIFIPATTMFFIVYFRRKSKFEK